VRWDSWGLFERFTERARQVVVLAQEESRALRHIYIGTEHILLGLLREEEGLAARVLQSLGITVERVRDQVAQIIGRGEEPPVDMFPFTPRAKKVLELALREALSLGHNYIGTEHILLGLLRENEGIAVRILIKLDAKPETIRNEVIRMLSAPERHIDPPQPRASGLGASIQVTPSPRVRRLLMTAGAQALDEGRSEIDASDVLLALTRDESISPLLADLGVDEAAIRKAIQRHPPPTDRS